MGGPRPGLCVQRPVGAGLGLGGGSSVSRGGMGRYHFTPEKGSRSLSMWEWFLVSVKEVALLSPALKRYSLRFPQVCSETMYIIQPEGTWKVLSCILIHRETEARKGGLPKATEGISGRAGLLLNWAPVSEPFCFPSLLSKLLSCFVTTTPRVENSLALQSSRVAARSSLPVQPVPTLQRQAVTRTFSCSDGNVTRGGVDGEHTPASGSACPKDRNVR